MLDKNTDTVHACEMYDYNKVKIMVAGFETSALIDSGASISVIDSQFVEKTCKYLPHKLDPMSQKICTLADSSNIVIDRKISLPIKLDNVTIQAELYVIPMNHESIILGCALITVLKLKSSNKF